MAMIDDPDPLQALAEPGLVGRVTLEGVLGRRRSTRDFEDRPITMVDLGQLLWTAHGVSDPDGLRAAPPAGALYLLEICAVARGSGGHRAGIYRYVAERPWRCG
jgi:nitroreductase